MEGGAWRLPQAEAAPGPALSRRLWGIISPFCRADHLLPPPLCASQGQVPALGQGGWGWEIPKGVPPRAVPDASEATLVTK